MGGTHSPVIKMFLGLAFVNENKLTDSWDMKEAMDIEILVEGPTVKCVSYSQLLRKN